MPRVTPVHHGLKRLPVDCDTQILSGRFAHALCSLIEHALDRTACHARDTNDDEGASAVDPAVLRTIIRRAYRRGLVSSRKIDAACRETMVCSAVSGDSPPHVTTLAAFVAARGDLAARLVAQVRVIGARQGLIGRERCASDGVQRPS